LSNINFGNVVYDSILAATVKGRRDQISALN